MLLIGCRQSKSSKEFSSTSISGQNFYTIEAKDINDRAVKEAKNRNHDLAEDLFFKALEIEPKNPTILSNIGLNYEIQENARKAIEYYEKSLVISDSTYLISAANLGRLYYQNGRYSNGIKILDFVIKNCRENKLLTIAHINRSFNQLGSGNCENAQSDLNFVKHSISKSDEINIQIERLEERIKNCVQSSKRVRL